MRDTPAITRRIITRNVPPKVTPTSIRRHGLFTPRGIFKRGHWNVRRLFGSPTYLPEHARLPARPISASPYPRLPRSRLDRSISWELMPWPPELSQSLLRPTRIYSSPESDVSFSAVFKKPIYALSESGGSPAVIKGPTRMYSPESDDSFSPLIEDLGYEYSPSEYDISPSSTIEEPSYRYRSSGSYRSSPSPLIGRRFHRSPSPFSETDSRSASSVFDTYSGSASSYFDTDSMSASPYQFDESFDAYSDRSLERTLGRSDTPALIGRVITRNIPPDVTPTSSRSYGLFTPRGIFKRGHWNVRRLFEQDPISELPPSPPFPRHRFDRTMSWEKSYGSPPESLHQPSISKSPKLTDSPLIKGPTRMYLSSESDASSSPIFKRPAYMSALPESDRSPSPAIIESRYGYRSSESDRSRGFHSDSSPFFGTDSGDVSPYQPDMSPDTSFDRSHERSFGRSDTPAIFGQRRVITRNVPPEVTPTSSRRYGLFTPRGIFKRGHWNVRRLFEQDPISELSPSPPFPRRRFDRTMSWEKSYGSSPESLHQHSISKSSELTDSPLIKGPTRMHLSSKSDASSSPVFKRPAYISALPESDTSPAVIKGPSVMYSSPEYDTSFSPVFQQSAFPEYDRSPSSEIKESYYIDSDSSSPSPFINRGYRRPLFETPPSGYESEFERSQTPPNIGRYESSFSSQTERTPDRSFSPQYPGGLFQHASELDDPLNRRLQLDEMFDSSRTPDRSISPHLERTTDRSFSPQYPGGLFQHASELDDPLNRRMRLDEMFDSSRTPDRSF